MIDLEKYLRTNPKHHLILDFDATLYWLHTDRSVYKQGVVAGLRTLDAGLVEEIGIGGGAWELTTVFVQRYGEAARAIINTVSADVESNHTSSIDRNPALLQFIRDHTDHYTTSLWSSNMTTTFIPVLEQEGMLSYFTTLVGKDSIRLVKGYPDGFEKIFAQHGGELGEYRMIGNSLAHDKVAAEAAGIDFFWIDETSVDRQQI